MFGSAFRRYFGWVALAALMLAGLPTGVQAQASKQGSLAYIDSTGNVQIIPPGASQPTALTTDADFSLSSTTAPTHSYTHLRWSPDGGKIAFQDAITGSLFVTGSGIPLRSVATGVAVEYPPAWLPDGSALAYVVNSQQASGDNGMMMAIQQVPAIGGQPQTVGSFIETQGCGGGTGDQPTMLYAQETGLNGNALTFAWTKSGWFYSTACTGIGLGLTNFNNLPQWKLDNIGRAVVSPSLSRAAGVQFSADLKTTALADIDLTSGTAQTTFAAPGVDQVSWSADETQILYSTIDGQTVSVWKTHRGGQVERVFSDQGRYAGVITTSADSQFIVFSYIPAGDNPQERILAVPMSGMPGDLSNALVFATGGRPAYSPASQSAISPTLTPLSPTTAACTPRTDWAFTYTIVQGDTLASVARRTGTAIDVLAAGNCLANANVIFVGQVLRVPVAVAATQPSTGTRIQFPAGATSVTVQGQLAVGGMDRWVLRALGGQVLSAQLAFTTGQAILIVWGADGNVLQSDHATSSTFSGTLPSTQDYYIDVRGNPSTPTIYALTVTVPPLPSLPSSLRRIQFPAGAITAAVQGQVAAGGADHWVLRILAGQTLTAQLAFSSGQAILVVWGADGSVFQSQGAGSSIFSGVLPLTEDYYIDVLGNVSAPTAYTLTVTVPPLGSSAPPVTGQRIQFPAGATSASVQGQLVASGMDRWIVRALAGQTLTAQLGFFSGQAILIVWGADGTVLISDHAEAMTFTGVLPSTQDYYIDLRGFSSGPTSYTLTVTIPPH